jgi:hypothetical protein
MTDMTANNGYRLAKLVVIGMVVQLVVIGYVFWVDHKARTTVVTAARAACELSKQDRVASVVLRENILEVFEESQKSVKPINSPERKIALDKINRTTVEVKDRSKIDCNAAFPKASLIP